MLAFKIALRFLKSSKGQTFLIILGISVGVSVQVFIGSLIQGLQRDLVNSTIGSSSQVTVVSSESDEYIENYTSLGVDIFDNVEGLEDLTYSLTSSGTAIVNTTTNPVLIKGLDTANQDGIYKFDEKLIEGFVPSSDEEVILGIDLVTELGIQLGDTLDITIPLKGTTEVTLVGIYDFKTEAINSSWVITTIPTVQTMLGVNDVVSSIEMQVVDVFNASELAVEVNQVVNSTELSVTDWESANEELLGALNAQSTSSYMIQVFVTISVILGITSVLAITVIQKSRQIGILKAMGIQDRQASLIFLSEGFLLGILGAIGGILLGLGLVFSFSTFALDSNGNPVIGMYINPGFIAISAGIAVLSASIASIIPARRSSKLSVIEVIKNG